MIRFWEACILQSMPVFIVDVNDVTLETLAVYLNVKEGSPSTRDSNIERSLDVSSEASDSSPLVQPVSSLEVLAAAPAAAVDASTEARREEPPLPGTRSSV